MSLVLLWLLMSHAMRADITNAETKMTHAKMNTEISGKKRLYECELISFIIFFTRRGSYFSYGLLLYYIIFNLYMKHVTKYRNVSE